MLLSTLALLICIGRPEEQPMALHGQLPRMTLRFCHIHIFNMFSWRKNLVLTSLPFTKNIKFTRNMCLSDRHDWRNRWTYMQQLVNISFLAFQCILSSSFYCDVSINVSAHSSCICDFHTIQIHGIEHTQNHKCNHNLRRQQPETHQQSPITQQQAQTQRIKALPVSMEGSCLSSVN